MSDLDRVRSQKNVVSRIDNQEMTSASFFDVPGRKRSVREEKKEGRQLRADHIDSLEMVVTLLPAGCCCSEKEETLDPPKIAHRCNGLPAKKRHKRCFPSLYNCSCLRHLVDMS